MIFLQNVLILLYLQFNFKVILVTKHSKVHLQNQFFFSFFSYSHKLSIS